MPDTEPLLNFRWHLPGRLASGGKPSRPAHVAWLVAAGFRAVVSLEAVPDAVSDALDAGRIAHLPLADDASDDGLSPAQQEALRAFIADHLARGDAVLVHCSAGIRRSVRACEEFLAYEDHGAAPTRRSTSSSTAARGERESR